MFLACLCLPPLLASSYPIRLSMITGKTYTRLVCREVHPEHSAIHVTGLIPMLKEFGASASGDSRFGR